MLLSRSTKSHTKKKIVRIRKAKWHLNIFINKHLLFSTIHSKLPRMRKRKKNADAWRCASSRSLKSHTRWERSKRALRIIKRWKEDRETRKTKHTKNVLARGYRMEEGKEEKVPRTSNDVMMCMRGWLSLKVLFDVLLCSWDFSLSVYKRNCWWNIQRSKLIVVTKMMMEANGIKVSNLIW